MKKIIDFLISSGIEYEEAVSGKMLTSFRVGGNVRLVVKPRDYEQIIALFKYLEQEDIRHVLIGRGSNIVISDEGFDGVMVLLTEWNRIVVEGDGIAAGAGASMMSLATAAQKNGLTGLEFAHGIPGSVGGGVYMNAGAYGGEMSQVMTGCECYDKKSGRVIYLGAAECDLSYRHSIFQDNKDLIVLGAFFKLGHGDPDEIRAKMDALRSSRIEKQPLEYPSAGSTFKRPKDSFAGKLIEEAGLKGYTVGGARVSEKHAGFVVNVGNATSKDIKKLVNHIKKKVKESSGVTLECEIEFLESGKPAFSELIREELMTELPHKTCCRRALAYGLLFDAFVKDDKVYIDTHSYDYARYYADVLSSQVSKEIEISPISKSGREYFRITLISRAMAKRLSELDGEGTKLSDYLTYKCESCRMNFLRGVFFSRATLTFSPGNDHLEFRIQHKSRARLLAQLLSACKAEPKLTERKNAVGVYYKKADRIEDILNLLQTNGAFFEVMNKRIEREISIQEHRAVNCESMNIEKQVKAAKKHEEAIRIIEDAGMLDKLDSELTESIRLRRENPLATLSELARMHKTPITKSVLNNRYNKLIRMADKLAENKK